MTLSLFILAILALASAIHITGPRYVDLPITSWSLNDELIYVASEIGYSIIDTYGQIIHNEFVGVTVYNVQSNGVYIVATTFNNLLIYTLDPGQSIEKHPPKLTSNVSIQHPGIVALNDYISSSYFTTMTPTSESTVDFYDYDGSLLTSVTLPYTFLSSTSFSDTATIFSSGFYPVNSQLMVATLLPEFPSGNNASGEFYELALNSFRLLDHLTIADGKIYGSVFDTIYSYNIVGMKVNEIESRDGSDVASPVSIYKGYVVYVTYAASNYTTVWIDDGVSPLNITIPYGTIESPFYVSLAISPSGCLVTSVSDRLVIYDLI